MTNENPGTPTLAEVEQQIAGYAKPPGNSVTDKTTPMSKLKDPISLDDHHALNGRFDFWAVQLAGDNAAYYNSHMPQYMHQHVIMPDGPVADLERAIDPRLDDLTKADGDQTVSLEDFLVGPARKQAMMMAHQGKVVFESLPGINTNDIHLWMSAEKTTVSTIFTRSS